LCYFRKKIFSKPNKKDVNMNYSEELQREMDKIVSAGKQGKLEVEGHAAAAAVYREHNMEGNALLVEQMIDKKNTELEWLKREWKRLKSELEALPY
jgi:uncharacterized protein YwgA